MGAKDKGTRSAPTQVDYDQRPPFRPARQEPLLTRRSRSLASCRATASRAPAVTGCRRHRRGARAPVGDGYAEVAGVSPVNGLYALLLPTVAYALLGLVAAAVVGPEGSVSTLVGAAVLPLAAAGSATRGAGGDARAARRGASSLARVLRLGWIADYFSRPVLSATSTASRSCSSSASSASCSGCRSTLASRSALQEVSANSATSAARRSWSRDRARLARSARFCAEAAGGADRRRGGDRCSRGRSASRPTASRRRPDPVGPAELRSRRRRLATSSSWCRRRSASSSSGFADEILTARSFAGKHNQHVRASQELLAMGAANAAAGFTQGFSVGASGSRTAVNDTMGARTQIAGLVSAGRSS